MWCNTKNLYTVELVFRAIANGLYTVELVFRAIANGWEAAGFFHRLKRSSPPAQIALVNKDLD